MRSAVSVCIQITSMLLVSTVVIVLVEYLDTL